VIHNGAAENTSQYTSLILSESGMYRLTVKTFAEQLTIYNNQVISDFKSQTSVTCAEAVI